MLSIVNPNPRHVVPLIKNVENLIAEFRFVNSISEIRHLTLSPCLYLFVHLILSVYLSFLDGKSKFQSTCEQTRDTSYDIKIRHFDLCCFFNKLK